MSRNIAILTSTRPLRSATQEGSRTVTAIEPERLQKLAERFDVVIVGSKASDDFFRLMRSSLPKKAADKFRLYARSYFSRFKGPGLLRTDDDLRDAGWQEILRENGIQFAERAPIIQEDGTPAEIPFTWTRLRHFLRDTRVTLIESPDDIARV